MALTVAAHPEAGIPSDDERYREMRFILSCLDSAACFVAGRRTMKRLPYRVEADLKLFSDGHKMPARMLYTRDINMRGAGFICPDQMPIGHAGIARVPMPDGAVIEVHCTVLRCRSVSPRWFEGAVAFSREQSAFSEQKLAPAALS